IQKSGLNLNNGRLSPVSNPISSQPGGFQFSGTPPAAPDRFIVKYKNSAQQNFNGQDMPPGLAATLPDGISKEIHQKSLGMNGLQVIQVPSASFDSTLTAFKNNPLIEYTEPDYQITVEPSQTGIQIFTPSSISSTIKPNDPEYPKLWGLHNTGQTPFNGTAGADISAEEAWGVATGSHDIVVAVLDSGVDYSHPDLTENIWTNEKEIPDNGIDDDGNGYIDDVHGWNFQGKNNTPIDENGHGTHCAGIIGAVGNNNIGVTGINWHVRIMPLRFMDSTGNGYISDAVSAIQYANQMGADVISCSWSGNENSQALKDAMAASSAVIVCASGNGGSNDDTTPLYPATFTGSNMITVAASDSNDNLASFSNYGVSTVNIAAPGVEIASTYPGNKYAYMSGTSMATPYVAGVAALLKAVKPTLSNSQIKDAILSSADSIPNMTGKISTGGRLNAYRTLTGMADGSIRTKNSTNAFEKTGISSQVTTSPISHTLVLTQPSELKGQTNTRISGVPQVSDSPPIYPYS
ncbi:MAG TPA: S8 family peptidase, partial [Methanospirillum sp.]|uniref:S8 family peptidase n=1 Tax=Methanospirillum sp. TaxID=45200 RepID=UPI002C0BFBF9